MPPAKKAPKKIEKAETVNDIAQVPSAVMQKLREKNKSDDVILISDYCKSDPIGGYISTNSFMLDAAIGFPNGLGLPYPAIVEIVGKESSAKSLLLYSIMGNMQKMGGWAQLVDAEGTFSLEYARMGHLDLSPDRFGYIMASRLEDGLQVVLDTVNTSFEMAPNLPLCVGYDSVAGSTVEAEQKEDVGDSGVARALHARILSRALRSGLTSTLFSKSGTKHNTVLIPRPLLIIFLNQLKSTCSNIPGQMDSFGGLGLKYHSRVRIQVERMFELKDPKDKDDNTSPPYGIRCSAKIIKNKVGCPYRKVEFDVRFNYGIEDFFPVMNFLEKYKGIEKSGSYFIWKDRKYYPNAFRDFMVEHPDEWLELKGEAIDVMNNVWTDKHSSLNNTLEIAE